MRARVSSVAAMVTPPVMTVSTRSVSGPAAVDDDGLAGHVRAGVTGQEQQGTVEVRGGAVPAPLRGPFPGDRSQAALRRRVGALGKAADPYLCDHRCDVDDAASTGCFHRRIDG